MKRSNRILALVICIFALIALSAPAFAAGDINSDSDLIIQLIYEKTPIKGAKLDVYRIADRNGEYSFTLCDEFSASAVNIDCEEQSEWNNCALALEGYALMQDIAPVTSGVTDENGTATFNSLKAGLYLVSDCKVVDGDTVYTSEAFIVALPALDADGSVTAYPKSIASEKTESVNVHVLKVWDDKGYESRRPDGVKVLLLQNGEIYDSVILSKENNWAYTWEKLDADSVWSVTEEMTEGYTQKIEHIGDSFKITNTAIKDTPVPTPTPKPTPPEKKLPQTGQLWWPVPALLCAGLLCVVLGIAGRKENE